MISSHLFWLALGWLGYFFLHSLLASLVVKRWVACRWPRVVPAYRILYNLVAVVAVLPLLYFTLIPEESPVLRWHGPWRWLADGLALLALAGFIWSLRWYDGQEFLGLRQLRQGAREVEDQERFRLSPLHRHVRHPWYFLGLILLWSRDLTPSMLVATVMATLYFIIGSRLEERKLKVYHGEVYERYCKQVPGLFPLPWRRISAEAAARLEREAAGWRKEA